MEVWVFFAPERGEPLLRRLELPPGATVDQAIDASGLRTGHPGFDQLDLRCAIAGQRVMRDHVLAEGDRLDLCRPLQVDPMTARRLRAAATSRRKPAR
jgi:putative ubiquitin-RnfH superfamily antitoxin RatB of RatAB toxin-antitoxin module